MIAGLRNDSKSQCGRECHSHEYNKEKHTLIKCVSERTESCSVGIGLFTQFFQHFLTLTLFHTCLLFFLERYFDKFFGTIDFHCMVK